MRYAFATLLAVALGSGVAAQSNLPAPIKLTSFAVDTSNMAARATTTPLDITINRWSTDSERDQLRSILSSKGQDALLHALQKLPVVGYINSPGSLRYDLHYARTEPAAEGGQHIVLGTDRYITAWEAFHQPRISDYPFTIIELQLDKDLNGVGKASVATKVTEKKDGTIELENFANQPVALNDVHAVK